MKTIEEAAKEYAEPRSSEEVFRQSHISDFTAGVEFAQRWITISDNKEFDINLIFKDNKNNYSVGRFEFIEFKLCVVTETGYSLIEDSGFTHFRPIELK